MKLEGADQEIESSEEEFKTEFDYDPKLKKDIEMDQKIRAQRGMLGMKKRRIFEEIVAKEEAVQKKREELIARRKENDRKDAKEAEKKSS